MLTTAQRAARGGAITTAGQGYRTYVLSLLVLIYLFNLVDRQVVTILAESIKTDLGLADWQLGVITGLSFALFYTVLGIPVARLADRFNRVAIISASLMIWSAFTALCGLSKNFTQLALLRVGVGVGEAGCTPAAHSLISDYVPRERRALALSIYALGNPLGVLVGLALGGLVAQTWGWRVAFFAAGAPGVVLGVIAFLTVRDPRGHGLKTAGSTDSSIGFLATVRHLSRKPSYWFSAFGMAGTAFQAAAMQAFAAPFFLRNHLDGLTALTEQASAVFHLSLAPLGFLGLTLGLASGLAGAAGILLGGVLAHNLGKRGDAGLMTGPAIASLLATPAALAACFVGDAAIALVLWGAAGFLLMLPVGSSFAVAQNLAPPGGRAMSSAILLLTLNLFGAGIGPLVTGIISDVLNGAVGMGPAEGVRYSLVCISGLGAICGGLFWAARARVERDGADSQI